MASRRKTVQRDPFGRELSSYEEEEEDAMLKDGQSLHVPLYLKDGAINPNLTPTQRAKAIATRHQNRPLVVDGTSKPNAMHRPGFRYLADTTRRALSDAAKAMAYEDADEADRNAWRGTRDASSAFRDAQEGDVCTVRGPEYPDDFGGSGTLQFGNSGELVCVPDDSQQDARPHQDAASVKRAAYEQYDREMADAWRGSNR